MKQKILKPRKNSKQRDVIPTVGIMKGAQQGNYEFDGNKFILIK